MKLIKGDRIISVDSLGAISALKSDGYTEYTETEKKAENKPTATKTTKKKAEK